jgi:hypothetical protein
MRFRDALRWLVRDCIERHVDKDALARLKQVEAEAHTGKLASGRDCGLVKLPLPPARHLRARPSYESGST